MIPKGQLWQMDFYGHQTEKIITYIMVKYKFNWEVSSMQIAVL